MKTLMALFLTVAATSAMAANNIPATTAYDPAQPLDVAEVVSITDTANSCDVVPATMVYVDHQGQTHSVTYKVMGNCSAG
jgi:hypothetical protein